MVAVVATVGLAGCGTPRPSSPFGTDTPLPTSTPNDEGFDAAALERMATRIDEEDHKLHGLLVARNGKLVFERYYNEHTRDTPVDIRSVTKSITSLLVGIALQRGDLDGINTTMMSLLQKRYPDVTDKDAITVRHLLTMSAGLDCDDRDSSTRGQEDRMYKSRDWVRYFLDLEVVDAPGDHPRYCTGGVVALGAVVETAAGRSFPEFADEVLFAPLGIENYRWDTFDEGRGTDTGGHLRITPQGLMKIGLLVLQQGRWEDRALVSAEWIETSTTQQVQLNGNAYGYLWWRGGVGYGADPIDVIMARGNGGQSIFIVPQYDVVTVATAGYYNSSESRIPSELFFRHILPAVKEIQATLPHQPNQPPTP